MTLSRATGRGNLEPALKFPRQIGETSAAPIAFELEACSRWMRLHDRAHANGFAASAATAGKPAPLLGPTLSPRSVLGAIPARRVVGEIVVPPPAFAG